MSRIPTDYIKREKVDFENEALSMLGAGIKVGTRYHCKPVSLGVMSLCEIIDNTFLKSLFAPDLKLEPSLHDVWEFYYINDQRENCLEQVRSAYRGDRSELDKSVLKFGKKNKILELHCKYVVDMLHRASLGFRMIPGASGSSAMIYGAESIAHVCATASARLNKSYDDVLWDTPMSLIGHIVATRAIENGVKDVERPYCTDHIKQLEKECNERDENGELHPWQIARPFDIPRLSYNQKESCLDQWVIAATQWIEKNGEQAGKNYAEIDFVKKQYPTGRKDYLKGLTDG